MKYRLDEKKVKKRLAELGYSTLSQFAAEAGIHRNTLSSLLSGQNIFSSSFQSLSKALQMDPMELAVPQSDFPSKVKDIDEIRPIVARLVKEAPNAAIILIGSRSSMTRKKSKTYSDWDLGIFSYPESMGGLEYLRLKGLTSELSEDLIRKIDLIHLNQAPPWFLEGLDDEAIFLDGHREAFVYLKGLLDGIQREKAA